jgi:tellurite resistance protein TehA-like permease
LPIGPLGQGSAAIIQLGIVAKDVNYISPSFAIVLHGVGVFVGLIMWGYAILWIVFAVVKIAFRFPKITFSMAWWGFTFPLGMLNHVILIQEPLLFLLHNWEKSCQ